MSEDAYFDGLAMTSTSGIAKIVESEVECMICGQRKVVRKMIEGEWVFTCENCRWVISA